MGWIKRNLIFVIGIVVALGLLGVAGFYIYEKWTGNSAASEKLNGLYGALKDLQQQKTSPGNDQIDNTKIAKEQQQQVLGWIASADKYFQPIAGVPSEKPVTSEAFAAALRRTVDRLQHEAEDSGVTLPPKYDFSFSAQRPLVKFAPGLDLLAAQLGEVKAISEILFAARINSLEGIQRVRVSEDDAGGPQSDYMDLNPVTNNLAVITPYVISFRCFTPELARVITAFASSTNAFLIKSLNVQPAGAAGSAGTGAAPGGIPASAGAAAPLGTSRGGLQTVLKEQLLHVTIEVELIKLSPQG